MSEDKSYIEWLEAHSMLFQAKELAKSVSGKSVQWQRAYAMPQAKEAVAAAPVWFSSYPPSMVTRSGQNTLQFLGDAELWAFFAELGITTLHTGPMERAGGVVKKEYTPTVDGWFDRIELAIDPAFGDENDYEKMVTTAKKNNAVIAGDIVPGHTGKGADFLLALRNYKEYAGIYDLIEIEKKDWPLLPKVENIWESVNLDVDMVEELYKKGYIPGELQRVLFTVPGAKRQVTGWDATAEIEGVDGKVRRFVYLHYFKPGQPTLNWLDPAHAAERMIAGDIIKNIYILKNKIVRLDANPFLGIEKRVNSSTSWSEGHPLAVSSSNKIAWLIRKLGGWSFQELNLTLDAIAAFSEYGPDLSYDFITRPAVEHALLTGDATFLHFMFNLMQQYKIDPRSVIHDMQNHDEITYELVHFLEHGDDKFIFDNKEMTGTEIRERIRNEMFSKAIGEHTPYNRLSGNGLCTTFIGLVATRLGIKDIYNLTPAQKQKIQQGHFLLAVYNALQPGVFGLSGWDLVGTLPLPLDTIQHLTGDGDWRWLNRGAFDMLDFNNSATETPDKIPVAKSLYGSVKEQLKDKNSFVWQIKHLIQLRNKYRIYVAKQLAILSGKNRGLVVMLHELIDGYEITALNFSDERVDEVFAISKLITKKVSGTALELISGKNESVLTTDGKLNIKLEPLQAKALYIK